MEFGQPPRIVEEGPPMPEDQDAGAAPEGIRRDFFFRESPPGRGLPDRGGDTRRRPQRAGPCGKAAQGGPPEEPTKE